MQQSPTTTIRLLLVDDHQLFLEGTARLLENQPDFELVGAVSTAAEAMAVLASQHVDVLLLDFDLGRERATTVVEQIRAAGFGGRVLIITGGLAGAEAIELVRSGIGGILHKHHGSRMLIEAIRRVASGESYLEPAYLSTLFQALNPQPEAAAPRLSDREIRMLRLIFQGLQNKEIANELEMTESAVKSALRTLFEKIGVKTRSQAVRVALEQYRDQL